MKCKCILTLRKSYVLTLLFLVVVAAHGETPEQLWAEFAKQAKTHNGWKYFEKLSAQDKLACTIGMVKVLGDKDTDTGGYMDFLVMFYHYQKSPDADIQAVLKVLNNKNTPEKWKQLLFATSRELGKTEGDNKNINPRDRFFNSANKLFPEPLQAAAVKIALDTNQNPKTRRAAFQCAFQKTSGNLMILAVKNYGELKDSTGTFEKNVDKLDAKGAATAKKYIRRIHRLLNVVPSLLNEDNSCEGVFDFCRMAGQIQYIDTTSCEKTLKKLLGDKTSSALLKARAAVCLRYLAPTAVSQETCDSLGKQITEKNTQRHLKAPQPSLKTWQKNTEMLYTFLNRPASQPS